MTQTFDTHLEGDLGEAHPFTVELVNGDRFEVDHRLALSITRRCRFFWDAGPGSLDF